ncbi:MAG: prepilin-type N-terminal cleavage/methylation domain-containing protein, partial [Proteobacteria bacterium]
MKLRMANLRSERGVTLVELMLVVLISGMVSV